MKLSIRETAVFAFLGTLMYASKLVMEALPNIHLLAVFTVVFTVVYRQKALYPIYIFVLLCGLYAGFSLWWIPHLYLWTILWGAVMLLPRNMPKKLCPFVYAGMCGLHGILYGTLYAPAQAIMFGLSFNGMISWIIAGLPWDLVHGIGNLCLGALAAPMISVMQRLERLGQSRRRPTAKK